MIEVQMNKQAEGQKPLLWRHGTAAEKTLINTNIAGFPTLYLGCPGGSAGKESACNAGDLGLIPGLGRSPGEGKGYPLQYSGLENSTDCIAHGAAKSRTQRSSFHCHSVLVRK